MNPHEFEAGAKAEHYGESTTLGRAAGQALGEHTTAAA